MLIGLETAGVLILYGVKNGATEVDSRLRGQSVDNFSYVRRRDVIQLQHFGAAGQLDQGPSIHFLCAHAYHREVGVLGFYELADGLLTIRIGLSGEDSLDLVEDD